MMLMMSQRDVGKCRAQSLGNQLTLEAVGKNIKSNSEVRIKQEKKFWDDCYFFQVYNTL
jgi:hypothetical protein